jgi:hypothetical protein
VAGATSFRIDIQVQNDEVFEEVKARFLDLSPAFDAFVREWTKLNTDIFDASAGKETAGAQVDPDVFWEPLTAAYRRAKQREGYPDQIMVRTGQLLKALTDPDLIFQVIGPQDAVFGSPLDPEEAAKVGHNWGKRQAIFFSEPDQRAFRRILRDYLTMGPGFEQQRAEAGLRAVQRQGEVMKMDADFSNAIASDAGEF